MRQTRTFAFVVPLFFSSPGFAANVDYRHPNVSIVAVDESLESVLRTVGKEMNISVTLPLGLNPTINCDIENKSVKKALKTLLGDLSYSMQWEEGGGRLVGLVIMADGSSSSDKTTITSISSSAVSPASGGYVAGGSASGVQSGGASYANSAAPGASGSMDRELHMAERQEQRKVEREEQEARFREERVAQEARHRTARLEEEAKTSEEHQEYMAREKVLFANGTPEL